MKYRPQLDGLRALAIVMVLVSHFSASRSAALDVLGNMGVQLFFVLSGFLITGILLEQRAAGSGASGPHIGAAPILRRFYVRRFVRIMPAYYLGIAVFVLPSEGLASFWHLAYLTNVQATLLGTQAIYAGHFWSLAVEEQFYLVWPLIMLLSSPNAARRTTWILVGAGPLFRLVWFAVFSGNVGYATLPFGCIDFLALGALIAFHSAYGRPRLSALEHPAAHIVAVALAIASVLVQVTMPASALVAAGGRLCWGL
jgi:peptidoglycan/LPS O-acetylase OafA/YrhL